MVIVLLGSLVVDRIERGRCAELLGVVCDVQLFRSHDVAETSARDNDVVRGFAMGIYRRAICAIRFLVSKCSDGKIWN